MKKKLIVVIGILCFALVGCGSSDPVPVPDTEQLPPELPPELPDPDFSLVPGTGQSATYVNGDDGYYSINPPSYDANDNGTVTDNITGLMWQRQDDDTSRLWGAANSYCEALDLGGHGDWRLPTKRELVRIVDYGRYDMAIDTAFTFPPLLSNSDYFWSATTYVSDADYAWVINFITGGATSATKTDSNNYVRCVRDVPDA